MDTLEMVGYTSGDMPEAMPIPEAPKEPTNGKKWFQVHPRSMEELANDAAKKRGVSLPIESSVTAPPPTEAPNTEPDVEKGFIEDMSMAPTVRVPATEAPKTLRGEGLAVEHKRILEEIEPAPPTLRSAAGTYHEAPLPGELVGTVKGTRMELAQHAAALPENLEEEEAPQSLRPGQMPPAGKAA